MRTFITHISSKLSTRFVAAFGTLFILAALLPAVAQAWGPERPTFTIQTPASYITFNSITNNPAHGDERNFMQVREQTASNESYADDISLTAGKQYVVYVYYHNNAAANLNLVAQHAYARAEVPAVVPNGQTKQAAAYVGASNANPTNVYDDIRFKNTTGADIALRYVPGSTTIHNFGSTNGATMPDTILSSGGVKLGYNALDGNLPGCSEYAGYVTFRVQADQPNFTFKKDVRASGTKEWKDAVSVAPGAKVDYLLTYTNTGSTQQNDVVLKDQLPQGMNYVPGSSKLTNASNPNGKVVGDGISTTGLNIGNYTAGSNAFLVFSAIANGAPCTTMTNTAAVETNNGSSKDTATVQIAGNCAPITPTALPTTGPVEVIAGLIGIAAITVGVVYYLKSRKDLEDALHQAQAYPTPTKSNEIKTHETHKTHKTHKK